MSTIQVIARHTVAPATSSAALSTPAACLAFADHLALHGGVADLGPFQAEAVILRLLRLLREGSLTVDRLRIQAESPGGGLVAAPVSADGDFIHPFPGGFYEWRAAELF